MKRQIFAPLESGTEGQTDGDRGIINLGVTLYGPDDAVPRMAMPLRELIAKHLEPATDQLVTGGNGVIRLTMPAAPLRELPPDTIASLAIRFIPHATIRSWRKQR